MESAKLPSFRFFCESEFHFSHRASLVEEGRVNVEIPASTIVSAVTFMGGLGLGSLLTCDQMLRTPVGFSWFGNSEPAVSDTTMARSLETMNFDALRLMLYDSYRLGRNQGLSKCPLRSGSLRIGIIDGSTFGRFEASCFEIVGPSSLMVDLEEIPKRGKELPCSYTLLRRLKDEFGLSFVDIILADGIYLNAPFFNLCLGELKSEVLVKTDDTTRVIVQDAISFLSSDSPLFSKDIIHIEGTDPDRMCSYSVKMADGFMMSGVKTSLSVAWVQEVYLRTGELTEFWVVAKISENATDSFRNARFVLYELSGLAL